MGTWYTGAMLTPQLPIDAQNEVIYQGICAVASHCDGAKTNDTVGFNGQDTKFGRRIASVPFDQWTPEIRSEAARIALTYRKQIHTFTGVDITEFSVIKDAKFGGTNHDARNQARTFERRTKAADKLAERKVDVVDGRVGIFYAKGDPDFGALLDACKALPGRRFDWDRKCNVVDVSDALGDFLQVWDFAVSEAALKLLAAPQAVTYNVNLDASGKRVTIKAPYSADLVSAAQKLPGRAWDGANKVNHADASPTVLALAAKFALTVHPDAQAACDLTAKALTAVEGAAVGAESLSTLLSYVSRAKDPTSLPESFQGLLAGVLA